MPQQYYYDQFDNGVVDCLIDNPNGNGTVTETTSLQLATISGRDCDWWYTVSRRGALAYVPIANLTKVQTWYLQINVSAINLANNTYGYLHCLIYDGTRMVWTGCQGTGPSYNFAFNYWNGADSNINSFTTTLPVKLLYAWDKGTNIVTGYYWGPSQSNWVSIGSYTMPWTPVWYGAGVRNWSGQQYGTANLSMMDVSYDLAPAGNYKTFDRASEYNTSMADVPALRTVTGQSRHGQPQVGQGYVLNDRLGNAGGIATPAVGAGGASGLVDPYTFKTLTGQTQHDQPQVGQGYVLNERGGHPGGVATPPVGSGSSTMSDPYAVWLASSMYQLGGTDAEGHAYFNGYDINVIQTCNSTNTPWNEPTLNNFSGYARDGMKYTNGVQDAGPVWAPWASEAASSTRSSRKDFPVKAAFVATNSEISILDLDEYPTRIKMWMRFNIGSSDNWVMIGSTVRRPSDIRFWNGHMIVCHSGSDGYMAAIDFKTVTSTTPVAYLIGQANPCFIWTVGKTIVDRNVWNFTQTGGLSALTTSGATTWYGVDLHHDGTYLWVAAATSRGPYVFRAWDGTAYPQGSLNQACYAICFDRQQDGRGKGWAAGGLYYVLGTVLFRNGWEYKQGQLISDGNDWLQKRTKTGHMPFLNISPASPNLVANYMIAEPPWVYIATNFGLMRVHQSSFQREVRYSTARGSAFAQTSSGYGTYPIVPGDRSNFLKIRGFTLSGQAANFMILGRQAAGHWSGGAAVIREWDNSLRASYQSPYLPMFDGSGAVGTFTY